MARVVGAAHAVDANSLHAVGNSLIAVGNSLVFMSRGHDFSLFRRGHKFSLRTNLPPTIGR